MYFLISSGKTLLRKIDGSEFAFYSISPTNHRVSCPLSLGVLFHDLLLCWWFVPSGHHMKQKKVLKVMMMVYL